MHSEIDEALFPPSERVFYDKAPLVEVVVQVRFPPILAIQAAAPVAFQERVRGLFPLFEEPAALPIPGVGMPIPEEVQRALFAQLGGAGYAFLSEDRKDTVTLTRDSVAYSSRKYTLWEEFRKKSEIMLSALIELYRPSFFTRVGLRYVDVLNRDALGVSGRQWSQLLARQLLGELSEPILEENIELLARQLRVRLPSK